MYRSCVFSYFHNLSRKPYYLPWWIFMLSTLRIINIMITYWSSQIGMDLPTRNRHTDQNQRYSIETMIQNCFLVVLVIKNQTASENIWLVLQLFDSYLIRKRFSCWKSLHSFVFLDSQREYSYHYEVPHSSSLSHQRWHGAAARHQHNFNGVCIQEVVEQLGSFAWIALL